MKALLGVWIAALAAAAGWIGWDAWQGDQPAIGGPFALTDQDGRTVTSDSLKGKPTLIYFGFTYLPRRLPDLAAADGDGDREAGAATPPRR